MKHRRFQTCAACVTALWLLGPGAGVSASKPAEQKFVWLSDVHFDPIADPALTDKLAAAEALQWSSILASSSRQSSSFGQDTNWPLFASAIAAIKKEVPDPAFAIVTGDLLPHHFRERFNQSASVHHDVAFRDFVRKTTEFVALQLKQIAPSKPVFISLGNNDSDCGDYQLQPEGAFLNGTLAPVADLLRKPGSELDEWTRDGSYNAPNPALRQHRIIAINTIFLSARYRDACGNTSADPGKNLMSWLSRQLAEAQQNHERVWLLYHIPPGIDGFATIRHDNTAVPFWKAQYAEEFDRLLSRYHATIAASFAGHTHMDDFRLIDSSAKARSLVLMTPALSPYVKQNPAFRVVSFEGNGKLTDQATYYLSNLLAAGKEAAPEWKLEYSFRQEWGTRELNYNSFQKLYRRMDESPEARQRWSLLYSVSRPESNGTTNQNFWPLHCASGHTVVSSYQACLAYTTDRIRPHPAEPSRPRARSALSTVQASAPLRPQRE